ncbi:hypothetical protein [Cellulosilyticum ruminicola]|uniref:hypothetical protein n=1 Tax=Cellulosilyticum ruminicola TaxID=425254 RepID=UPI0006D09B38|nr:hypothetical protein [Cellulosilyticum ruminicola]
MRILENLLMIRQNVIKMYKQYDYIAGPILKFIMIYIIINMFISKISYEGAFTNPVLVLFISLIGVVLNDKGILLGTVVLVPLYVLTLNPILAAILFIFLIVIYILFMRLFPKESLLIIVTLVAFSVHMENLIPIVVALLGGYVGLIGILLGVFIWFLIPNLAEAVVITGVGKDALVEAAKNLTTIKLDTVILDQKMLCVMIIFFVVFNTVYFIRRLAVDYAPYIAIGMGAIMNMIGFSLAILFLKIDISLSIMLITTVEYALITIVIEFFSKVLDYERSEILNFEDDENYYYVKVVPKIYLTTTKRKVKRVYNGKTNKNNHIPYNMKEENKDTSL